MATKNIVPRADGEGNIGTSAKNWLKGFFKSIFLGPNGIVDGNDNEVIKPESVANAVNEITVKNAAIGNAPEIKATGDDTDINFIIRVKGSGAFQVMDGAGNILATFDKVTNAVNYITLLNAATANGVTAKAVGSDTDIDFVIKTKGAGKFQVVDGSGNEIAEFHTVASAVNFLKFLASVTGNTLKIEAVGDDTDIDITLVPKGLGSVKTPDGKVVVEASSLTTGQMLKVNADGIIENATNTDAEVADAVTKKHSQNTDTGSDQDPFSLTGKLKKSVQAGITAHAGGGQADAVEITKDIAEISVCATAGDSVKLPAAVAGLQILIMNHGVAAADVFPNTDDAINEQAANAAKSLAADNSMLCTAYDDTNWECLTLSR